MQLHCQFASQTIVQNILSKVGKSTNSSKMIGRGCLGGSIDLDIKIYLKNKQSALGYALHSQVLLYIEYIL